MATTWAALLPAPRGGGDGKTGPRAFAVMLLKAQARHAAAQRVQAAMPPWLLSGTPLAELALTDASLHPAPCLPGHCLLDAHALWKARAQGIPTQPNPTKPTLPNPP